MTTIQQTSWEVLPMGEYLAVVTDVRLADGLFGQQCEFVFTLEGGEYDGTFIKGWTSAKFSPKSKLFKWAQAIFGGAEIPPDYDLVLDHLVGQRVTLRVTIKVKDDNNSEFNKVDSLRAYHPPRPAGAAANGRPGAGASAGGPGAGRPAAGGGPGSFPPEPLVPPDDFPF